MKKVCSLENIYEFSYPYIVHRASSVDIIWFNHRKLPYAFFEVEYSTDFQNSLLSIPDKFFFFKKQDTHYKGQDTRDKLQGKDIFQV